MQIIELDGRKMDNRIKTHAYLKQTLSFPEYYGANLDALHDCLTDLYDVSIILRYSTAMLNRMGEYGCRLIRVFEDVAGARGDFKFRVLGS